MSHTPELKYHPFGKEDLRGVRTRTERGRAIQRVVSRALGFSVGSPVTKEEKAKSRSITAQAVRYGIIDRYTCFVCGSIFSEAHHMDYSKPLQITWLCHRHHRDAHRAGVAA